MKKLAIILALMLTLTACSMNAKIDQTDETEPVETAKVVKVSTIQQMQFTDHSDLSGDIITDNSEMVSTVVSGTLLSVNINVGDTIKKGDIIACLDDEFLKLQSEQATIDFNLSKINLDSANRSFKRTDTLYKEGAVTKANYEAAEDALSSAKLAYQSSRNRKEQMNYQLKHMQITAPISGVVSQVLQKNGASVGVGMPICEIVNTENLIVQTGVSENLVSNIQMGQNVKITVPALNKTFIGAVETIAPIADRNKNFPIRIKINNKDGDLRAGMFAELNIQTKNSYSALAIPKLSVINEQGEDYCFIIKDNHAIRKSIELGASFEDYFEVQNGLTLGDTIVILGQNYLANDDLVEIVE